MGDGFDEIDRRIVYELSREARHTSAPDIAEQVGVSPPTVRNRIGRLESEGVIRGYHAQIDYEKLGGRLTNLFLCTASATDRKRFAERVLEVPGVVNVREVMTGDEDLHVVAVGSDMADIRRIAREIAALGVHIDDEDLLYREHFRPYTPFATDEAEPEPPVTGIADISDDADVVEVVVGEDAPIDGKSLEDAAEAGLLDEDVLVVSVRTAEQDDGVTPDGGTVVSDGERVTLFSRTGLAEETLRVFTGQ
ncbi:MAG: Lrp/AsnC family transcriptional regulator [Haloarculaceae archaeon]